MLRLRLDAPFAASRPMTAGWYRPTARMLAPSTLYGLLLNIAGVESRLREEEGDHTQNVPASLVRSGLPTVRLAVGIPENAAFPQVQTIYQQLHNYPVGAQAGIPAEWTKGTKNNITPVRRELLSNVTVVLCIDVASELEDRVRRGLNGEFNAARYGLPFVGDNSFLIDKLEEVGSPLSCRWYEQLESETDSTRLPLTDRLTIWIDRSDMSKTKSALFAPTTDACVDPPSSAWVTIPPR